MKTSIVLLAVCLIFSISSISAEPMAEAEYSVVVTTAWTAAFAHAAGVESVHILAPYEMKHPSEYELKPSDIPIVQGAEAVIFAGYERTVEKIKTAAGTDATQLIQITTTYSLTDIEKSLMEIADRVGSRERAEESMSEIRGTLGGLREEVAGSSLSGLPVIVHVFQVPLAKEIGLTIAGTFGPAPLEARQIETLSKTGATLIIDNAHNPIGTPVRETLKDAAYVQLINFPGTDETRTLTDVISLNGARVRSALQK